VTDQPPQIALRLAFVPGATPGKWARIWAERLPKPPLELVSTPAPDAASAVLAGGVDAALLRLPVDRDALHAIPLYEEVSVVVFPKDHVLAALDEVAPRDLADEVVLRPLDDPLEWGDDDGPLGVFDSGNGPTHALRRPAAQRPATTGDAIELVAAGVGVVIVPQSLARLHHRKDLAYRPMASAPTSTVALAWPRSDENTELMDQLIGIVRGRTINSSRGSQQNAAPARKPAPPKPVAAKKPAPRRNSAPGKKSGAPRGRKRR
jgi:DNA-binding transcriptional LysR family regulator